MTEYKTYVPVLILRGEKGRKIYESIKSAPRGTYNAKKASKEARKNLRKQGFFI